MKRARTALASLTPLAAAALVLTAAAPGSALPPDSPDSANSSDSESSIAAAGPTQRGREVVFTVTTGQTTLDAHEGYLTVESPAFVKKLTLKEKRFREGKNGRLYTRVAGMVPCDLAPGTYPVDLKDGGEEEPAESVELTVVPEMDPGNREFCDGPRGYDEIVDRTSETAPDEDDEGTEGVSLGELAAVIAGTATLAAVLASTATYLLTRKRNEKRNRRDEGGQEPEPEDAAR
ncbi:hypothetical protein [Streptomyces hesseae]|uniref:LPXTG cell wall anchor domain-containing protein n=1 Tax=Streptomyces hesseae TaxID=3075519 RepID=A0ABU2SRR0_9ACTN|nr:hypothetical protein [Streptomyces sp. DSM 40473]MDT0451336.1 hypothetical protein [Streptomyces sp. DSM 40473]